MLFGDESDNRYTFLKVNKSDNRHIFLKVNESGNRYTFPQSEEVGQSVHIPQSEQVEQSEHALERRLTSFQTKYQSCPLVFLIVTALLCAQGVAAGGGQATCMREYIRCVEKTPKKFALCLVKYHECTRRLKFQRGH
ncbi:hypothetical protein ScPMuIL_017232 [Solemya velum]